MRYKAERDTAAVNQLISTGYVGKSLGNEKIYVVSQGRERSRIREVGSSIEVWIETSGINR